MTISEEQLPWDTYPPVYPPAQACAVFKALGYAIFDWPSGRRTLEMYEGTVTLTEVLARNLATPQSLIRNTAQNLDCTMQDYQESTVRYGYFIRQRHGRRKARRITSVEWVRPSRYHGPRPVYPSSVLPI